MNESIQSHVIRRIMRVQNRHGRAVTAREVYSTSSRDREDVVTEIERLIDAGIVATTRPDRQGMGRPTTYLYLVNEWEPTPDARALDPSPELIDSGKPNPYVKPTHRTPHPKTQLHEELAELTSEDRPEEYFQIMGPHVWVYLNQHTNATFSDVRTSLIGSKPDREQAVLFAYTWQRLNHFGYDECFTKWRIEESSKTTVKSGLSDRRQTATRYYTPERPPTLTKSKSETQEEAQERRIKSAREDHPDRADEIIEAYRYPEPSDHLPDMSRFEATVTMLLG